MNKLWIITNERVELGLKSESLEQLNSRKLRIQGISSTRRLHL